MKKSVWIPVVFILTTMSMNAVGQTSGSSLLPGGSGNWKLLWADEFNYPDAQLDANWYSANGTQSWILCSRWRENAVVSDGTLKLVNKKETRGGQEWTSGSIWTKKQFQYGYYECRYKYAAATGTNNSFWIMTTGTTPTLGKNFEIDINEGHYSSEIATNLHNWSDVTTDPATGKSTHPSWSNSFNFSSAKPDITIQLETPVTTKRIRFSSTYGAHFHIQEFRIYNVNAAGYPSALSPTADSDVAGLINFARDPLTKITSSGIYGTGYETQNVADGGLVKHWVSQDSGEKWLEFEFASAKTIGCLQFVNGWLSSGTWNAVITNYKVQYHNGTDWVDISTYDASLTGMNLGKEFHTYGLEWSKDSLIYYFDGKALRKMKNDFCLSPAPVYLSEAIIPWAGEVTDAIDGTRMEVDYVRIYERLATSVQTKKTVSADIHVRGNNLVITSENSVKLELFTLNGTLLTARSIPSGSYSMNVNRQGIYLVRLSSNTAVTTRKIVINTDY
ncbi:MAG: family 16 glycosylhydrolase [Bacteroidota bacterium]|nr:family 16 glycosylhydrolase [Bacteroidota bacterium]